MIHVTRRTSTIRINQKKNFNRNLFSDSTFFLDQKFFWTKHFFHPNNFLVRKFFRPKIFFRCKFFLGPKFFPEPKFFRPKFFLRPKICSDPKWISMKMIFGGLEQRFEQRFYLNWSLTLKTKSCKPFVSKCPNYGRGSLSVNFLRPYLPQNWVQPQKLRWPKNEDNLKMKTT